MNQYLEILKNLPLFEGIEEKSISLLLDCLCAKVVTYRKNQSIIHEGIKIRHIGIVLEGSVRIVSEDYYGNRNIITTIKSGEMFAEALCFSGIPYSPVFVYAEENTTIMHIDSTKIGTVCERLCTFHTQVVFNMLKIVSKKNLYLNKKNEILSKRSTTKKLMAYLLEVAKSKKSNMFSIPYNRQELADYLGVDRSAMCSVLSTLKSQGVIDYDKDVFKIIKPMDN